MLTLVISFLIIMAASVIIGWAAEITAVHLSAGIALAVLAWLQTSPEFAVEASIAWAQNVHLALANLTGSIRLLLGLGWPMIFFIHWISRLTKKQRVREVTLSANFAVEALGLALPVLYFLFIYVTGKWSFWDGLVLTGLYGVYFYFLNLERKSGETAGPHLEEGDHGDEPWVVRKTLKLRGSHQKAVALGIFAMGGIALFFTVHPFVESLKAAALTLGVSEFVFIQWIAPIASEFPEKITAFNWARHSKKVPLAIVNMLSSVTSQWSLLAGLIPLIFSLSAGSLYTIELDAFQRSELLLTIAQSLLAVVFVLDLKIRDFEAAGMFVLWLTQLLMPSSREELVLVYLLWIAAEGVRLAIVPNQFLAWKAVRKLFLPARRK